MTGPLEFLIVLAVLGGLVVFVSAPLRRPARSGDRARGDRVAELEAAREAKYRELRDADLDHRTGKLSRRRLRRGRRQPAGRGDRDHAQHRPRYDRRAMTTILGVVQVFICVLLVFLILMHSGKDSGLSGAFGVGTGAGPFGGGSLVERNLNRWTIGFAVAFVVNTIILIKIS